MKHLMNDNGIKSRKLHLTILGLFLVLAGALLLTEPLYLLYLGGITGILGLYFGANVSSKLAIGKVTPMNKEQLVQVPEPDIINESEKDA